MLLRQRCSLSPFVWVFFARQEWPDGTDMPWPAEGRMISSDSNRLVATGCEHLYMILYRYSMTTLELFGLTQTGLSIDAFGGLGASQDRV